MARIKGTYEISDACHPIAWCGWVPEQFLGAAFEIKWTRTFNFTHTDMPGNVNIVSCVIYSFSV